MTFRLFAVLAAATLLLAACGTTAEAPSHLEASPTQATGAHLPAQLQFSATTLDGGDFDGPSVLGTPTVFWFWAPWCPVCQREAPLVGQVADANPEVTFVGVAAQDELPAMQEFVERYSVAGFSHLADSNGSVWAKFGVTHQPAYAFLDADGNIDVVKGTLSESELTERVSALGTP